ncbi:MAG: DedA family protein [Gammaproteobacteria bacterium]|nr:DedA family protein [Gammaproteobacteria bacterium]
MKDEQTSARLSPFARLYRLMQRAARHPRAPWWLAAASAAEASFFPLPPDIMLAPMTLENPRAWLRLATLTTLASVAGGVIGYGIGHYLIHWVLPVIGAAGYGPAYQATRLFFAKYGFWALVIKGLTPLPYKIFTITAGAVAMPLLPFIAASLIGRGIRFYLLAGLLRVIGPRVEPVLARYIDWFGWMLLVLIALGFWWLTRG